MSLGPGEGDNGTLSERRRSREEGNEERDLQLAQAGLLLHVSASRAERRRKSLQLIAPKERRKVIQDVVDEKALEKQDALDEYNTLLSGLSQLHDDAQLHLVYSVAIEAVTTSEDIRLLAEALHHRWLSDPAFPPVAAKLALFFADLQIQDLKFGSMILSMVMNDWRDRLGMRKTSHTIFANSVYFAYHFYFAFRHRDPVFKSLVDPLFEYLHMLVDKDATDGELLLAHRLFCTFGADIAALHFHETQIILLKGQAMKAKNDSKNLPIEVRHKIIDADLKHRVRGKLLEVIDLSYAQFEFSGLSEDQQDFYLRYHVRRGSESETSGERAETERASTTASFVSYPNKRQTPRPSSRRESVIF